MKFSYKWLKELSGTEKSPEELAGMLLTRAFEVEEICTYRHGLDNVVVGEVLETMPHPDADRLKVTQVETGDGICEIVCGAPNVAAGQKVAVALPGAKLPNGIEISESEIRGVKSAGMICAPDELGFGTDHTGIWVLPDTARVGVTLVEAMALDDTILDVKILPNRGTDALSHFGLAREIAALEGRAFPSAHLFEARVPEDVGEGRIDVDIVSREVCSAYVGLSFTLPERVAGLPLPMLGRMVMLGARPIHPAADIANSLSLLAGQPMHAFDADKLSGPGITVRYATEGETLVTLDDRTITLTGEDLIIADGRGPIALAGIIGGKDSAVSSETREVFFEIANFDAKTIRRSRVRHGFVTDAAYLFEHAVDRSWPENLRGEVVSRFSRFLGATCTGMTGVFADVTDFRSIDFTFTRIEAMLGIAVPEDRVLSILRSLSIDAEVRDGNLHTVAPAFRPDLGKEADIIEEIGRVYGYEHIGPAAPVLPVVAVSKNPSKSFERSIKEYLTHRGWDEIMTYSFYEDTFAERSGIPVSEHLELRNPMNPQQRYFRVSLLPSVLEKTIDNIARTKTLRVFEVGSAATRDDGTVSEEKRLAFALVGRESVAGESFAVLKGEIERLFRFLGIPDETVSFESAERPAPIFHPGRTARIVAGVDLIGVVGEAYPGILRKTGERKIALAEILVPELLDLVSRVPGTVMTPIPRYPYVTRDVTLSVPEAVNVAEVIRVVRDAGAPLLRESEVFDVYSRGDVKSVSIHLAFGADDRTITGRESDEALQRIQETARRRYGVENAV